ncbi:MAG: hypothetical protein HY929_02575, partial [Euryarchaeota archaeon]|nr:hypothetical protein [Euryarchaeota archaeon]
AAEAEEINIIKITERKALEEIAKLRLSTQQKASEEANKLIRESEEYVKLLKQKSEKNLIKATTSIVSAVLG